MKTTIRSCMRVIELGTTYEGHRKARMLAVYEGSEGAPDDAPRFCEATPHAELDLSWQGPEPLHLVDEAPIELEVGAYYYVDLVPLEGANVDGVAKVNEARRSEHGGGGVKVTAYGHRPVENDAGGRFRRYLERPGGALIAFELEATIDNVKALEPLQAGTLWHLHVEACASPEG